MSDKRSQFELKRLVEQAVADTYVLAARGLWLCVDQVETHGRPPEHLKVWATLHFLLKGSPFCCGEPAYHFGGAGVRQVSEHVRTAMHLRQPLSVDFGWRIGVNYHKGVTFHYGSIAPKHEMQTT